MPGCLEMASRKPLARSMAGAAPVVPWSSAMLQLPPVALASHSPAIRPSATKSEAISVAYKSGYDRGEAEGRAQAREDRVRNQGYDAEGQRELDTADSGYEPRFGPKADYQAGYRAGWRHGYPEGWRQP